MLTTRPDDITTSFYQCLLGRNPLPFLLCYLLTPCLKSTGHQPSTNRTLAIAISGPVDSPSLLLLVASAHLILHDNSCRVMLHACDARNRRRPHSQAW